ncbi:MAG: GAF domain-containing protein [Anaerolineae bacterium]|nr:GAF domain-containing protein [Anaerolineae bacterium]
MAESRDQAEQPHTAAEPRAVLWLGSTSPLYKAAWSVFDVYRVDNSEALLQALQNHLTLCLVVDLALPGLDAKALLQQVRAHSAYLGVLALVDVAPQRPITDVTISGVDSYLSRDATPIELETAVRQLIAEVAQRLTETRRGNEPGPSYDKLQDRMRRLEGLVQAAFSIHEAVDESEILGDLREVARIAVDADDLAVLLTDSDLTELVDGLNLGIPGDFLDVCREQFLALSHDERQAYLSDEVLLRERLPGMLRSAVRVREAEAAGAWSYMRLPLIIDQQLIGCVALFAQTPGQFNGAHLQLGRLFAAQVATAVRNMRLYYRLHQAERRQRVVSRVADLITKDLALDTVLTRIVEEAIRLVDGTYGLVLLVQPDKSLVVSAIYQDSPAEMGRRVSPGEGQAGIVAETGQPSVITNYRDWPHAVEEQRQDFPDNGILFGVPLKYRGVVLGVLQVIAVDMALDHIREAQDVLTMLAPQAATAIAKAQLHETVYQDRQQLRAILDHTVAVVIVCDQQGTVLLLNSEAQRIVERLGFTEGQIRGRSIESLSEEFGSDLRVGMTDLDAVIELNLGELGEYLVRNAPITGPDGKIERYVFVAHDVSQLRRLDRMKSDLIHVLSHDLRNPLGLARGSIDLIDEPDILTEERTQLKEMIIDSLERMDQLIKDVVNLEMADTLGEETIIPYQLPAMLAQVVQTNRSKAERQGLTLEYEEIGAPSKALRGHALLIGQAVDNLINNAIKYTPEGGHIRVSLTVEKGDAVIRVEDTGYGIPEHSLPYVFDQFYRAQDDRTRHIPGSGLGLSLVRAIAQAHGGNVTVKSTVNVGSVFTFRLPFSMPSKLDKAADQVTRYDLSNLVNEILAQRSSQARGR